MRPITKIAVIDSGIDPNHPDLAEKIIDPISFGSGDPTNYIDEIGHGTHVAGIAAAITNNKIGVAGASYNTALIVPIKVNDKTSDLFITSAIKGIMYAIDKKVDVINMSFGFAIYTQAMQLALEKAWEQEIVSVAAAGNDGNEQLSYPAAYNFVLGVSATDKTDRLASFSSWGVDVGITAPGTDILSTVPGRNGDVFYTTMSGTSMAAPFVSGVAAMLRAIKPLASNQEIIQAIQRSARSLNTKNKEWSPFYGYGLLNLSAAVQEIKCPQIPYGDYCEVLGSFYGQVVDSDGNPVGNATVEAFVGELETENQKSTRKYKTKCTTYDVNGNCTQSDGMFRLSNLPGGNYTIVGVGVDPNTPKPIVGILVEKVVLGTDVYVKLVLEDVPAAATIGF
ncbi:hypothetical protein CN585_19540 [Bacillus toyonensis]|uniref:Peptidase S8/S53 domain-containing protein n=2 Tax=Bacillus toyonensis TaxID=155322 RepID=A0A2A8HC75_9BACI|nr:hypothetical protein CN585_19540 [Bacillus toyonensis]